VQERLAADRADLARAEEPGQRVAAEQLRSSARVASTAWGSVTDRLGANDSDQ